MLLHEDIRNSTDALLHLGSFTRMCSRRWIKKFQYIVRIHIQINEIRK
jgi:hypothetical protein